MFDSANNIFLNAAIRTAKYNLTITAYTVTSRISRVASIKLIIKLYEENLI
jgi:hypothetical protein